jgi:nicotinic acid phosphoribosyltransferase
VGAMKGYEDANSAALDLWEEVYPNALLIALTDTFSTAAFFKVNIYVSLKSSYLTLIWHSTL